MAAITWHGEGSRIYEAGLDRGVLYVGDDPGVAWNGLTSIDESPDTAVAPVYFEGRKINDIVTLGNFAGVLRAFTYPDEFLPCEGIKQDQVGTFLTDQPLSRFGLVYRTLIGEGNDSLEAGYKIHILYNLTAIPAVKTRQTLGLDVTPQEFSWNLTSIPEDISGYRPTSHLIIDSRDMDPNLLKDLEDTLYGDDTNDPRLPSLQALTTFIRKWDRFIVRDNGDGTWDAIDNQGDAIVEIVANDTYDITTDNIVVVDPNTYDISSSDKNEEDF